MSFLYFCLWVCDGLVRAKAISGKTQRLSTEQKNLVICTRADGRYMSPWNYGPETAQRGGDKGPCAALSCPALREDSLHPYLFLKLIQSLLRETRGSHLGKAGLERTL